MHSLLQGGPKKTGFYANFSENFFRKIFFAKTAYIGRDRHASELESLIRKPLQIRFRIEICALKNPIVKKNRIKNAFSLEKLSSFEYAKCP